MNHESQDDLQEIIKIIADHNNKIGYTSSPSTNTEIEIDISHKESDSGESVPPRVLGEMVLTLIQEGEQQVISIGQIVNVRTENKWHSDISFKGVVKQFGKIPHLSGSADVRIATISVQSSFVFQNGVVVPYTLGISPSTGGDVAILTNNAMQLLIKDKMESITYIGKAYGAQVSIPFYFKHFGKDDTENKEYGTGDAYHIGVFGKTGSGKTVMSSMMLLGYAKNKNNISMLILDPQAQFYHDNKLLPDGNKFQDSIEKLGMSYTKYILTENVYLSDKDIGILSKLLLASGFIKHAFPGSLGTEETRERMTGIIQEYISNKRRSNFSLQDCDIKKLLIEMFENFIKDDGEKLKRVYIPKGSRDTLQASIESRIKELEGSGDHITQLFFQKWEEVLNLYQNKGDRNTSVEEIVEQVIQEKGKCIVLSLASKKTQIENENLQALFIDLIQKKILEKASIIYERIGEGDDSVDVNTLIVLDEAHRFASSNHSDPAVKALSKEIVDAVRTTRKFGVGYMFITQSLDSLDEEIIRQMRIYSFGYGLTTGAELRKVKETINNDAALSLYRSFIDPGANDKYPFMFYGPASPLSFTGAPVFIEAYTTWSQIEKGLKGEIEE